jgi:hypothetical protein
MSSQNKAKLDLLHSEGEGIVKETVKKRAETKFNYPDVTHHLHHQFNNWYGVLQVCFSEHVIIVKEARVWISHEPSYYACFKAQVDFGD